MKNIVFILLITFTACSLDEQDTEDPVFCTTNSVEGLEIIVKSKDTNDAITEGITVIATDNDYTERLQNISNDSIYIGAFEREGNYTITISGEGYKTFVSTDLITVTSDVCHVITENREFSITPN